jgi:hypothetical protein
MTKARIRLARAAAILGFVAAAVLGVAAPSYAADGGCPGKTYYYDNIHICVTSG